MSIYKRTAVGPRLLSPAGRNVWICSCVPGGHSLIDTSLDSKYTPTWKPDGQVTVPLWMFSVCSYRWEFRRVCSEGLRTETKSLEIIDHQNNCAYLKYRDCTNIVMFEFYNFASPNGFASKVDVYTRDSQHCSLAILYDLMSKQLRASLILLYLDICKQNTSAARSIGRHLSMTSREIDLVESLHSYFP